MLEGRTDAMKGGIKVLKKIGEFEKIK